MDIELAQALTENELLKSLLYCTKRSCNNCGKVNCENFQMQRKDYCENWVSYKDYIKELETQIEKMKCCSMCKYYNMDFLPYFCIKNSNAPHCTSKCDKWEIKEND